MASLARILNEPSALVLHTTPTAATRPKQNSASVWVNKNSLSFILCTPPLTQTVSGREPNLRSMSPVTKRQRLSLKTTSRTGGLFVHTTANKSRVSPMKKSSKLCIIEDCISRAKHARKCWRHGGSIKCKVAECTNRAKSKGVCWSHGGGTLCTHPNCGTIAVSHGFCWAHGGGKRCQVGGCSRPAYERTDNYCTTHHKHCLRFPAVLMPAQGAIVVVAEPFATSPDVCHRFV